MNLTLDHSRVAVYTKENTDLSKYLTESAEPFEHTTPYDAPAWVYMNLKVPRLPRNTWLVHFTDDPTRVSEEGFLYGVSEKEKLAFTTILDHNDKKYGGYNFAYVAGSPDSVLCALVSGYGEHAVMFQSSGVEVYHEYDNEDQVIFWGKAIDPATIVSLEKVSPGEWQVRPRSESSMGEKGRRLIYSGDFKDVVNWVQSHHFQYRKQIMGK